MAGRIDTHHHFLPQIYIDAVGLETLAAVMPNRRAPDWSAELSLAMMQANDIGQAILSVSSGPTIPRAAHVLRGCNEEAARLRSAHPGRFGNFASLPLPDIDASLEELSYSLDTLGAEGVILFTNYDGNYPGDPRFAPLLEELHRRRAVVFLHPNQPPYSIAGQPPAAVLEFPFDTTRAAASLILSGALAKYPDIRFILSHAGGTLPFLSARLAGAVAMDPATAERVGDPMAAIRHFYFDTALAGSPAALAALAAVADPARILFGSDFPMAPEPAIRMFAAGLAATPLAPAAFASNAARLLDKAVQP